TWTIALRNASGGVMQASNNGFRIHDAGTATNWPLPVLDTLNIAPASGAGWKTRYDGLVGIYHAPTNDGLLSDTVAIGGFNIFGPGFPNGFDFDVITITLPGGVSAANDGRTICLDSSFYDVNEWLWSTTAGGVRPDWSGPHCYTLFVVPNECPNFTNCPGSSLNFNHCNPATYDFNAVDPPYTGMPTGDPITYAKVSGPGTVNAGTGVWNYSPTLADVGASITLKVTASDGLCGGADTCSVSLNFTNVCPTFTAGCGAIVNVGKGNPVNHDFNANSNDCDPISFYVADPLPGSINDPTINPGSGLLSFQSEVSEGGLSFVVNVGVTDGKCSTECAITINVLQVEPFEVQIEKTHGTHQGTHELVCITLNKGSEQIWGFDFLIAYDQSALSFVGAIPGEIYDECGWEYFNYRYGASGNCSNACPSGLLRVVGLAETNNGPNHPDCYLPYVPIELFCLDFLVTNDRTFECQYVPIRFFWVDCGDNTISYNPSDDPTGFVQALALSRQIHEHDGVGGDMANGGTGFPTYYGAQDVCLEGGGDGKPAPLRFIDFINGGVDIVCADSIDDRGDINLNGLSNEIADAVLFTNYFVYGMGVFTVNPAGQIAATDVNADGIVLSVADLVYLIRIVIGDVNPYPKLTPVESVLKIRDGVLSIEDVQVGAASIVTSGTVKPTLLADADGMVLISQFDGANNVTRSLIYSPIEVGATFRSFTGSFLNIHNAELVGVEMATADGAPILAKEVELPTNFALDQNYPNPFNPKTTIRFALPTSSEWTLSIYNVTGQKVTELSGVNEAGFVDKDVDLGNNASGVYFYKLVAGLFTDTKKMILVK
ncbi:MAG: T9SS type A sorting domain-containing protein, partial [Candidatus Zixiibacteriota bacterium]